ncbi:hypothetical protein [Paraburkholderia acidisoli]|uniref:Transmembrane protein n=1 Tax=Paraburkholderia acidisoli TaxID=2571748 RepID=A0A7Z2GRJ4_9BURK|nr:hypothetical protein [Paraburkholderia acidisoli]QGZ66445.1 hypothetical protein FAZ98_32200 [Paraburkholderia acidisoli]
MLRTLFQRALLGFAIVALIWLAVFVWWHETNRMPTSRDIVAYLFALPIGLIVAYALMRRAIDGIRTAAAPLPASRNPEANVAATAAKAQAATPPARLQRASVLHTSVRAAPGNDAAVLLAALSEGARAPLDTTLADSAGFPVFAARVKSVDDSRLDTLRAAWKASGATVEPNPDEQRAIALLEDTVLDALEPVAASLPGHAPANANLRVRLDAIVPRDWNAALDAPLAQYLRDSATAFETRLQLDVTPVRDAAPGTAFTQLDLAITALDHAQRDAGVTGWHIVAATHSALSEAAIMRADLAERLYTSRRQHGEIAGEAAAAIVLRGAPARDDANMASDHGAAPAPLALITCSATSTQALGVCIAPALANAQAAADTIGTIVADSGTQSDHAVELARGAGEHFPKLEPLADTLALDVACGANGAANALLAVALAAQRVKDTERAALAATFASTFADTPTRAALVMTPPTPATTPEAAQQAAAAPDTSHSTLSTRT